MGLYVYCAGRPSHPEPVDVHGLEDTAVRADHVGPFSVWVSELASPPRPTLDGVRIHNQVVEAACASATPLPFRYGQWFESGDDLAHSLRQREPGLTRSLERVDHALEHGVRIIDPARSDEPAARTSGKAYLESLARRATATRLGHSRGQEVASALRGWLGPIARDMRVHEGGAGTLAVVAFLVDRHDTGTYERRIRQFPAEQPDLKFVFTGPWPPYGFVE
jgi:hypothetical protein